MKVLKGWACFLFAVILLAQTGYAIENRDIGCLQELDNSTTSAPTDYIYCEKNFILIIFNKMTIL